jgi:hypothetical protein
MITPECEVRSIQVRFSKPTSGILSFMFLALMLAGCAAVVSPGKSSTSPTPSPVAGAGLQITTASLSTATVGTSYSATLAATGGVPPYTWSLASGSLPEGLQLAAYTGTISGTTSSSGNFTFKALVIDTKAASSSVPLSLRVASLPAPTISSVSPSSGPVAGGTAVTISGINFRPGAQVQFGSPLAVTSQVVSTTQIQATTPAEASGSVSVTVQNSDMQAATAADAFQFIAPLQVATTILPVGAVGNSYSSALTASGGVPPYSWSQSGGSLPAGLQLNALGTITGSPILAGAFSFAARVQDKAASTSSSNLSLNISPDPPPTVASVSPSSGPSEGGTTVTISGGNFRPGAEVTFGNSTATSLQVLSASEIQAVTPAESSGTVSVSVHDSDGQLALDGNAFTFTSPAGGTAPVVPAASSDPLAPKIFNASSSARAGDIGFIQGSNFDSTSQAWLGGATATSATQLTVLNRVGITWMAVQIPQSWTGALVLWVSNSHGASKSVALNGAVPSHLDALQLVPGGAFRVLGKNLLSPGFTPTVTIDGQAATLNLTASDENTLVATAPNSLAPDPTPVILVDNGNGTSAVQLDRPIGIVSGSGDPFALGVGWGAGFAFAAHKINVSTPCNGTQDDSANIQAAINSAASSGGGVVQLPAGACRLTTTLYLKSRVVLRGAGKTATIITYDSNYPINTTACDLVGIADFSIVNSGAAQEGPMWVQNTRSFILRVKIDMGVSRQLFLGNNTNFLVAQTDFIQRGSIAGQNPYLFNFSAGLVFSGNTSTTIDGSPTFQSVHDALFVGNHFTRDASLQYENPIIVTHRFVMDFAYRIAVVGNTFDVINGPITNKDRNDGETLQTEGGGAKRTENIGTVTAASGTTLSDINNTININPFGTGLPEDYGVAIVNGKGAGQTREVVGYSNHALQVDQPWDVIPDTTSQYATFVWGLEKSLLKGNTLTDNPRGIWLYQTAIRDVDVLSNTITNGGGIYVRTFQSVTAKQFDPIYDVRIRNNKVANSNGLWMSYINVVYVNTDKANFGIPDIGIEIAGNSLSANTPNVTSNTEEYANREGFMNLMRSETTGGQLTGTPMVVGTILQNNQCLNCSTAFVIGTGDYGTVLSHNLPVASSPNFLSDWKTLAPSLGGSLGTLIQ